MIALAGVKVSFFDAAILMVAPVEGLRPSRSGVAFTLNFPNPGIDVSVPLAAASAIALKTPSTIDFACALVRLLAVAISSAISFAVVLESWLLFCSHLTRRIQGMVAHDGRRLGESPIFLRENGRYC